MDGFISFLAANALAINLLCFLLGLLCGHWFALGRDKRQEFNGAAVPVREWAIRELERPGFSSPSLIQIDWLIGCMGRRRGRRFLRCYRRYGECCKEQSAQDAKAGGAVSVTQNQEMRDLLEEIVRLMAYR